MSARLAADIGGTFTDLVLIDQDGVLHVQKTASTPDDFKAGVLNGVKKIIDRANESLSNKANISVREIDYFVHGATVVLNALLQRKLPATALITTAGFRDVLEIMRTNNPLMYDMQYIKPAPLIPRRLRFEVAERVRHTGEVFIPLDEASVRAAARSLVDAGAKSVAVCLMHAYANPAHERRIRDIILDAYPELVVCISSDVASEQREFERTSTVCINAATVPIITSYLDSLTDQLRDIGLRRDLYVMQSNGGVITSKMAQDLPVRTVLSGPSGGVVGGTYLANEIGLPNAVTLDMGGTSTDIGLIANGKAMTVDESHVDGWPILAPMIEILAIGAGGGSIGWIDAGGGLRVGPQSAGAKPGPVCYRRGGTDPTVSDACLVLGRLNPEYFLGGEMDLDVEGAHEALVRGIAKPLDIGKEEAAQGMVTVVTANMAKAMRQILVARGMDPRDFTLMAFGGAGGMVVGDLLRAGDVKRAIVPNNPGALCAIGMLVTDFRHDASATMVRALDGADREEIEALFSKLEQEAYGRLVDEDVPTSDVTVDRYVDVRYIGQEHYLKIPIASASFDLGVLAARFNNEHERVYGHAARESACELVNLRVTAIGKVVRPNFPSYASRTSEDGALKPDQFRSLFFDGKAVDTAIYKIESLRSGDTINGPTVIEDPRSTVVVLPGQKATIDRLRNILVEEIDA